MPKLVNDDGLVIYDDDDEKKTFFRAKTSSTTLELKVLLNPVVTSEVLHRALAAEDIIKKFYSKYNP